MQIVHEHDVQLVPSSNGNRTNGLGRARVARPK